MDDRDDHRCSADCDRPGEGANGQERGSKKIAAAAKLFRAATAVVIFGVPLITGTAALLGYGIHKAYERLTGRS
jgi:hypothetical protein